VITIIKYERKKSLIKFKNECNKTTEITKQHTKKGIDITTMTRNIDVDSPGTKENPVCIDLDEEGTTPENPVLIDIDEEAGANRAETAATVPQPDESISEQRQALEQTTVPQPDESISEQLQALEQTAFDTDARWEEARSENQISWLATEALMNIAQQASEALKAAREEARIARENPSEQNGPVPPVLQELEQASNVTEANWSSSRDRSRRGWYATDGLMDTAFAAYARLDYARTEIRVDREDADRDARNARAERGEAEESVADRRSRAREIAAATQRGINNRLRVYEDERARTGHTTTPAYNGANGDDFFGMEGPASRDMALLFRQNREGRQNGASELSEAVRVRSGEDTQRRTILQAQGEGDPHVERDEAIDETSGKKKQCPFCNTAIDENDNEALVVDKVKPDDPPVWDECPICHEIRPKMLYKCCDKKQYSCLSCAKKVGFLPPKSFDEEEK
jgi:hypothetical protein